MRRHSIVRVNTIKIILVVLVNMGIIIVATVFGNSAKIDHSKNIHSETSNQALYSSVFHHHRQSNKLRGYSPGGSSIHSILTTRWVSLRGVHTQQTRGVDAMFVRCWHRVVDGEPPSNQCLFLAGQKCLYIRFKRDVIPPKLMKLDLVAQQTEDVGTIIDSTSCV